MNPSNPRSSHEAPEVVEQTQTHNDPPPLDSNSGGPQAQFTPTQHHGYDHSSTHQRSPSEHSTATVTSTTPLTVPPAEERRIPLYRSLRERSRRRVYGVPIFCWWILGIISLLAVVFAIGAVSVAMSRGSSSVGPKADMGGENGTRSEVQEGLFQRVTS